MEYSVEFKSIKGVSAEDVKTRTLSEMGFPVDVRFHSIKPFNFLLNSYVSKFSESDYAFSDISKDYVRALLESQSRETAFSITLQKLAPFHISAEELKESLQVEFLYDLEPCEAKELVNEFVFIVKELLPRRCEDIFSKFDFNVNPAYEVFFDLAVERLDLRIETDTESAYYGELVLPRDKAEYNKSYVEESVRKRFMAGETLCSIYNNTCAVKSVIKNAVEWLPFSEEKTIETALFSLSKEYYYEKCVNKCGERIFSLYHGGDAVLFIVYLSEKCCAKICDDLSYVDKLSERYSPLLLLDWYADKFEDGSLAYSKIIRKVLKNPECAKEYTINRIYAIRLENILSKSYYNSGFLSSARRCGCFLCNKIFSPQEIQDTDESFTVSCPYCGRDSVIMDAQGLDITDELLRDLKEYVEYNYFVDDDCWHV